MIDCSSPSSLARLSSAAVELAAPEATHRVVEVLRGWHMQVIESRPVMAGMGRIRHIFMVGIGGAGMSGIAEVLAGLGYTVTGSDRAESAVVARLRTSALPCTLVTRLST